MGHSFDNLDRTRSGAAVRSDLVQEPRVVREGHGWREELIGALPEMFYEVYRLVLPAAVGRHTYTPPGAGSVHVVKAVVR